MRSWPEGMAARQPASQSVGPMTGPTPRRLALVLAGTQAVQLVEMVWPDRTSLCCWYHNTPPKLPEPPPHALWGPPPPPIHKCRCTYSSGPRKTTCKPSGSSPAPVEPEILRPVQLKLNRGIGPPSACG